MIEDVKDSLSPKHHCHYQSSIRMPSKTVMEAYLLNLQNKATKSFISDQLLS